MRASFSLRPHSHRRNLKTRIVWLPFLLAMHCAVEQKRNPQRHVPEEVSAPMPSAHETVKAAPILTKLLDGHGPLADQLAAAFNRYQKQGRSAFVYVGATWCEPCKVFKKAVQDGALPSALANTVFIEFDLDTDEEALKSAGYESKYIPLFALVSSSGRPVRIVDGGYPKDDPLPAMIQKVKALLTEDNGDRKR